MTVANQETFILAGDIGGTKTNLGLFIRGKRRPILKVAATYSSLEAPSLSHIIHRFLEKHDVSISSACFGIAGPVMNGRCKTTNLPWDVSERSLKRRFGWDQVMLVNDLAATACAVPLLTKRELFSLNQVRAAKGAAKGIIAPGTGLGMALLIWRDGQYVPVASEGSHADFAPKNKMEIQLWQYLHQRVGHVSVERVLSGPGLFIIYCWLKYTGQETEPTWLAEKMDEGDPSEIISEAALVEKQPLCVKALDMFVSIFGAAAGNLALTGLTRGGIYLGGGIAPKILPKLREGLFMKAFVNKGRFSGVLSQIPVQVILNERAALLGAAVYALRQAKRG
ncbi:MAG: glucokinase [Deltaproteobacteria bacterium]|nr:glucokinase [Deltaproteobacteria bacterium]MBW2019098.1 glucokinase [Deltaproteobacteria bacterium]MBW2073511.1 glucokinase [Deltaproteobacteria bacterium]RLB80873.1 MAG: glucokinase [Deltaproteobacteria bacterium]